MQTGSVVASVLKITHKVVETVEEMIVYQLPKQFKLQQWQDVLPLKIIRNTYTISLNKNK
jgi:hypothetical protein